jgi:hypothetical protein
MHPLQEYRKHGSQMVLSTKMALLHHSSIQQTSEYESHDCSREPQQSEEILLA